MVTLHLRDGGDGRLAFTAEKSGNAAKDGVSTVAIVREVVWFHEELEAAKHGVIPSLRNLLMFLSDVRGRKFKRGIFLGDDVLALAEEFRTAARGVVDGRVAPDIAPFAGGYRAVWRPVGNANALLTDALMRTLGRSTLEDIPGKADTLHDAWLIALRSASGEIRWPNVDEIESFRKSLSEWLLPLSLTQEDRAHLKFILKSPESAKKGAWRLQCSPPNTRAGLMALGQAALVFPPLRLMRGGEVALSQEEVEAFVRAGADNLSSAGFVVEMPDGLLGEHVTAQMELSAPDRPVGDSSKAPAQSGDVTARLKILIDGVEVGEAEIEFLLAQRTPFVFFNNHWIEIDRFVLKDALKAIRSAKGKKLSMREAVSFSLGMQRAGRLKVEEVRAHGWLRGLLNELRGEERFSELPPPEGLKAELRDYQRRGVSWLAFLSRCGFGPLLADDMGLGKTIQTIAWILHLKKLRGEAQCAHVLVIAPVSVTTNWMREIVRFAPSLSVYLHQGADRATGLTFQRRVRAADVTVAGYSLLVRDFRDFVDARFAALVLDEAQMIKNPDTRAAKAARGLGVPIRMALTGTPLENSAGDLWSLQEFLNPGLLGERRDFMENFVRPIREDSRSGASRKLRHILEPFILRRLKTDPGVAAELGEKREVREYCPLSPDQRRRYEDALAEYMGDRKADAGARERRGRVLALLTELKQICDGDGKFERLVDLLEEIFESGESALVFTQYAKVGRAIRERLEDEFGARFPFLHGDLSPAEREREIDAFNSAKEPNVFILSLRAGGFGLNLTRATHVIHFDRWWNPAVENQATDRAHRIGQTCTVFVHLFISPGTLEDRIDELLESKRRVAGDVVGSGETFLLKMSDEDFAKTVALDESGI